MMRETFIWLNAESFKPVISKTLMHVPICRPCFCVAAGYNKKLELIKREVANVYHLRLRESLTSTTRSLYSLI